MNIPVSRPYMTEEEARAASETILSHWVTQGPRVAEFEEKFASYVGAPYAVAVSSCTAALHLALTVSGIETGDEVICPSLSFIATANSIVYTGAKPVFADIDQATYNIDPASVELLITPRTKAVLIVHQMGMPADIDAFKALCARHRLLLIEDAACAAGSSYKGRKIGAHSELVCFSFHPRKVITTGDGGMIVTSNKSHYDRLKRLRQHGMSVNDFSRHQSKTIMREEYLEKGYNYRMTDIQAAVGIKQLEKLDWLVKERRKIAETYTKAFQDIACLNLPIEPDGSYANYQSYAVYLKQSAPVSRDGFMQLLLDEGIATRPGIMTAHREQAYKGCLLSSPLPRSEDSSDRSVILPLYVPMGVDEVNCVVSKIKSILLR